MPLTANDAEALEELLRIELGHDNVLVKRYGKQLLLQRKDDEGETVARLKELGNQGLFTVEFRNHTGRYELLPGQGRLKELVSLIATHLAPYFDPNF